jgi:hypothetical protein
MKLKEVTLKLTPEELLVLQKSLATLVLLSAQAGEEFRTLLGKVGEEVELAKQLDDEFANKANR